MAPANGKKLARSVAGRLGFALCVGLIVCAAAILSEPLERTRANAAESAGAAPKSFFLVARRDMGDPMFQQSVILMLPPDQPPLVAGVIINKPSDIKLNDLFKHSIPPSNSNDKVYFGGPVELNVPLLVVHAAEASGQSIQLTSDAYAIADIQSIAQRLKNPHDIKEMRFYLGRAQWTQEQLRGEILEGAWDVMPIQTGLIFGADPSKVWPTLIQHEHVREVNVSCEQSTGIFGFARCDTNSRVW